MTALASGPLSEDRITEVQSPNTKQFGTGYLLGADIVITAAHVVAPRGRKLPRTFRLQARPLIARRRGEGFKEAELIWPSPPELVTDPARPDLTLLRLKTPEPSLGNAAPMPLGFGELSRMKYLSVTAVGFPSFRYQRDMGDNVTHQIIGDVAPLSGFSALPGASVYEIQLKQTASLQPEQWKGISGAALFAGERLIGVLVVNVVDQRFVQVDFKAVRLSEVENDPSFLAAIGKVATFGSAPPPRREPPSLKRLICLLDRDYHELKFSNALKDVVQSTDPRSLICFAAGPSCHLPGELQHRFRWWTLPELHAWPEEASGFRVLALPPDLSDANAALQLMQGHLAQLLVGPGERVPEGAVAIRENVSEETRPRLFCSGVSKSLFSPGNRDRTAALLKLWVSFWGELSGVRQRPPVHVLIAIDVEQSDIDSVLSQVEPPPSVHLCRLPAFEPCQPTDLQPWFEQRLPKRLTRADIDVLDTLRDHLTERFISEFSYFELRQEVTHFLQRLAPSQ